MTAHLSDSDRQALCLARDLREQMRQALPAQAAAPSVSPFVDPSGRPAVLMKMDEETARSLMALLGDRRAEQAPWFPETRRADAPPVPPPPEAPMAVPQQRPYEAHVQAAGFPAPMPADGHNLQPTGFPLR